MPISNRPRQSYIGESTAAQREIWMAAQMSADANRAFNESVTLRLRGALNTKTLGAVIENLCWRHDVLRARLSGDGRQLWAGEPPALDALEPLRQPRASVEDHLSGLCTQMAGESFRLDAGPLVQFRLLRLAEDDHALVISCHRLLGDSRALKRLARQIAHRYAAPQAPVETPHFDFAERLAWENGPEARQSARAALEYWTAILSPACPFTELPLDRPRPPVKTFAAGYRELPLSADCLTAIRDLAEKRQLRQSSLLTAAFAAFLTRLTGQAEVLFGLASTAPQVMGLCENPLPLKLAVSGEQDFTDLATWAESELLQGHEYRLLHVSELLKALNETRDPSRPPLYSAILNLDPEADVGEGSRDAEVSVSVNPRYYEHADLFWDLRLEESRPCLACTFNIELWEGDTIARRLSEFATFLEQALTMPRRPLQGLQLFPSAERRLWEQVCRGPEQPPRAQHLSELLDLRRFAERPAVACGAEFLSFEELDRRSSQLANYLRSVGIRRNDLVGVFVERSAGMLVSLLASWKAGAAYVALDPAFPGERLRYMAEAAQLKALITESNRGEVLGDYVCPRVYLDRDASHIARESTRAPELTVSAADTAYVIFTSGSTGRPKGVRITHGCVINFLESMAERPGLEAQDRLLAVTTLSFDIAVMELCLPLLVGGRVIIAEREEALDGYRLMELIQRHRVNTMQATPTTWRWMLAAGWEGDRDFKVLCGGEAFPPDLARQLILRVGEVWNLYGPTEATVWSTCYHLRPETDLSGGTIPVGTPIHNTQCYVLDEHLQPLPAGVPGELFIGGDGVADGYLNRPELTGERFIRNTLDGRGKLYRTGDRARWRADGNFECLGRLDSQIKLRGYRIELGEIEAALARHPEVLQCAATVVRYSEMDQRLVAYARTTEGSDMNSTAMRRHLQGFLPDYMLPQLFVQMEALPVTANGKIDRNSLPHPDPTQSDIGARTAAGPTSETERGLIRIWSELLMREQESVEQLFLDAGGHSLLAMDMVARVEQHFGVRLHVLDILVSTVEQLAAKIDQQLSWEPGAREPRAAQSPGAEPAEPTRRGRGLLGRLLREPS